MRRTPLTLSTLALAACLTLAGCGQDAEPDAAASTPAAPPTAVDCSTVTVDSDAATLPTLSGADGEEPAVSWGGGQAPENLTVKTLTEGSGAQIGSDDVIVANYVGWEWDSSQAFDTSWGRGAPASFSLKAVIPGWTCGLAGTHVGDRVLLSIPAELAYGEKQPTPSAAAEQLPQQGQPSGDLVFVVDVLGGGSPEEISAGTKDAVVEGEAALAERGVSVSGSLGEAATITVNEGAAEPTEPEVIVLARGSGAPLEAGSKVLAHTAGAPWAGGQAGQPFSTWDQDSPQVLVLDDQPPLDKLAGVPAGSRVVILMPKDETTGTPASAFVMDIEQVL
ncbi:FKBP-type peptidyl-prolyl cis-trans isomerase [Actinomyces capricornis]|uniref:peptidylprolyl isomerase n=1 Tax=Actinomyces capricornis TaxID=2755559 RepID=A0ABM7UDY5_9ACTO|nr:FKBP-type peptidyl-prolyl cis-trans isomerase [Actinomyces capricornis]BDA65371.1 hypothetical protein MANAM107_22050 [Actinomyces capricornis]